MVRTLVAGLLCAVASPQEPAPIAALVEAILAEPADERAWAALAGHDEPGLALQACRALLERQPASAAGWRASWRLADRVGDHPLGAAASQRALELCAANGSLGAAAEAERVLALEHNRAGLLFAVRQDLLRWRALARAGRLDTRRIDDWLARIEAESRARAHPDPEQLRATAAAARERGDVHGEHRALVDLAYSCWVTGAFREGHEHYQRVLAIDGGLAPEQQANDRNGAGRLALEFALTCAEPERGRLLREARELAREALRRHEAGLGGVADRVRDHCVLSHVAQALGEDAEATLHCEREFALVQQQRAAAAIEGDRALRIFHGATDHIYEDFALLLAAGGPGRPADLPRALAVSEIGRTGALAELYRLRGLPSPSWIDQDLPLAELQRRAGASRTGIVVWFAGSRNAAVAVITGAGVRCFVLGPLPPLDEAARALAVAAFDLAASDAAIERAGRSLCAHLLAPALPALAGLRRLVLVGTGRWSHVPFAALVLGGPAPLRERWLAARYEVALAPTLGCLTAPHAPAANGPALAIGFDGAGAFDPGLAAHFGLVGLPPLQRAEHEAEAVARMLAGKALTGAAATEARLRELATGARFVHFAGHALVDDEDSTKTALLLAPDGAAGDGFLTLGELLELRLSASLVTCSACRTARGEAFTGEAAGALARCLLAAGARNLLVSLAPIDDAKAAVFVRHLGAALARSTAAATALAHAQRAMLAAKTDAHPAFWSAFVLHGQADLLR